MSEYIIITNRYLDEMEKEVNQMLQKGWALRGELIVAYDAGGLSCFQVMTRRKP